MSFIKQIRELWDHLRGKGPAAAVAVTIDLAIARDNKPFFLEAGAIYVEKCDGDLYARVNGPNGDGMNLQYIKIIRYPVSSLYLTNTAQSGKSARLLLLPQGMDADPPAAAAPTTVGKGFAAYMGATQSVPPGTNVLVAFSKEVFDDFGEFDPSTYYFTPAVTGNYLVGFSLGWLNLPIACDGILFQHYLSTSGGSITDSPMLIQGTCRLIAATTVIFAGSKVVRLTAGIAYGIWVATESAAAQTLMSGINYSGFFAVRLF